MICESDRPFVSSLKCWNYRFEAPRDMRRELGEGPLRVNTGQSRASSGMSLQSRFLPVVVVSIWLAAKPTYSGCVR